MTRLQNRFPIVDARSGRAVKLRRVICYSDGICWKTLRIDHFNRRVLIEHSQLGVIWITLQLRRAPDGKTQAVVPSDT